MRYCPCGALLTIPPTGRPPCYCSPACKLMARRRRRQERRARGVDWAMVRAWLSGVDRVASPP
jgi:hypothetical protein